MHRLWHPAPRCGALKREGRDDSPLKSVLHAPGLRNPARVPHITCSTPYPDRLHNAPVALLAESNNIAETIAVFTRVRFNPLGHLNLRIAGTAKVMAAVQPRKHNALMAMVNGAPKTVATPPESNAPMGVIPKNDSM